MRMGTRSLLFGAHQIFIHPWFVAWAWRKLYGFPWDPRLWVAFAVHDWGYFGCPNMDGEEGEAHVFLGARLLGSMFDCERWPTGPLRRLQRLLMGSFTDCSHDVSWYCLVFYHSRFTAKKYGRHISRLGIADKLSIVLTPWWLFLPLVRMSGEWREYTEAVRSGKYAGMNKDDSEGLKAWFLDVQRYLRDWVAKEVMGRGHFDH